MWDVRWLVRQLYFHVMTIFRALSTALRSQITELRIIIMTYVTTEPNCVLRINLPFT